MPFGRTVSVLVLSAVLLAAGLLWAFAPAPMRPATGLMNSENVMLVLRGTSNPDNPKGQLDDASALEYGRRLGFRAEVLDVAGDVGADTPQVRMALERIRHDDTVRAIYGFSGGGYNARLIWNQLSAADRERIQKVVVVGSPGVADADFRGAGEVRIVPDPPEGHMAGPRVLLEGKTRVK